MSELGLDSVEARVLGVLMEKEITTPDAYPLSLNAVTTGCNQKSNREPVALYTEGQVRDALERLVTRTLVREAGGAGARTRLSVRPERLVINPGDDATPNRYRAKVSGMNFRGDHTLVHLLLASGTQLEAKVPNSQAEGGFGVDGDVEVGWQARHCRALDPPA